MNITKLKEVIAQQQDEVQKMDPSCWCAREEEALFEFDSSLAQIVIGVRRSGKSTLCHKVLKNRNIPYAYINFDDDRLTELSAAQFDDVLEALYFVYRDFQYLFLDEPQNIETWHLFVNRLLRQGIHVFLTGSNSKLLSVELATHLTGRYNQIELYPLSFAEYLELKNITYNNLLIKNRADTRRAFEEYLNRGGLPEILNLGSWKNYVRTLFTAIIDRDIMQRFKVRYKHALHEVAQYAIDNYAHEVNYEKVAKNFGVTSANTVKNYFGYLEQAYIVIGLNKFSYKSSERIRNKKIYIVDTAFVSSMRVLTGNDFGWRLENIVYIELLRRRYKTLYEIHYYKANYEIDFVISLGHQVQELVQVTADISAPKTLNREVKALIKGSQDLQCSNLTLITLDVAQTIEMEHQTIKVIPITDWLCQK